MFNRQLIGSQVDYKVEKQGHRSEVLRLLFCMQKVNRASLARPQVLFSI